MSIIWIPIDILPFRKMFCLLCWTMSSYVLLGHFTPRSLSWLARFILKMICSKFVTYMFFLSYFIYLFILTNIVTHLRNWPSIPAAVRVTETIFSLCLLFWRYCNNFVNLLFLGISNLITKPIILRKVITSEENSCISVCRRCRL